MSAPFEGLLGNSAELRLLEFLLPLDGIEFDAKELSEEIETENTIKTINKFIKWGLIKTTIKDKITYYSINSESQIVKSIEQLNNAIIENILGDDILYEIHDYWESRTSFRGQ